MKPAPFDYERAATVEEAVSMLSRGDGYSVVMAGGQTLGPLLNLRLVQPDRVIDISGIESLRAWGEEGDEVVIGAGVSHAMIEDGLFADPSNGLLACVAGGIAYRSVRNRGTLGGSLAYADPAAEWPTVMTALGARVDLHGPDGTRTVPVESFVDGPMSTGLAAAELLVGVRIEKRAPASSWGFKKLCRKSGDFAEALAVVVLNTTARIVLGATPAGPLVMAHTARFVDSLEGGDVHESDIDAPFMTDLGAAGVSLDDYERQIHRHTLIGAIKDARGT